jgi:hypothetical protein
MRYNEKEEIEATNEWLMRFDDADFSEELLYVPSTLSKLGVAPIDVVDRLDWLRKHGRLKAESLPSVVVGSGAPSSVMVLEKLETVQEEAEAIVATVVEEETDPLLLASTAAPIELKPLTLDYDGFGAWEWAEPIETMIENAIFSVFDFEPGLHEFNELASSRHLAKRSRGKRARASARPTV